MKRRSAAYAPTSKITAATILKGVKSRFRGEVVVGPDRCSVAPPAVCERRVPDPATRVEAVRVAIHGPTPALFVARGAHLVGFQDSAGETVLPEDGIRAAERLCP